MWSYPDGSSWQFGLSLVFKVESPEANGEEISFCSDFGSSAEVARFCTAFDEIRQYFRSRSINQLSLPLSEQRQAAPTTTAATSTTAPEL